MTDLDNKQTDTTDVLLDFTKNMDLDYIKSPMVTILDSKLLRRRKFSKPLTYRRPNYLQYIDYV